MRRNFSKERQFMIDCGGKDKANYADEQTFGIPIYWYNKKGCTYNPPQITQIDTDLLPAFRLSD